MTDRKTLFDLICAANETLKTLNIKGKDYVSVNERIKAFRMCYPDGFIVTELLSDVDGVCKFRATVGIHQDGSQLVLGVGHAYEKEKGSFINSTSYIENCETSAVGRALGMAGFGIDVSLASAEELANALLNQQKDPAPEPPAMDYTQEVTPEQFTAAKKRVLSEPVTNEQLEALMDAVATYPELADIIAEKYGGAQNMTKAQAASVLKRVRAKEQEKTGG